MSMSMLSQDRCPVEIETKNTINELNKKFSDVFFQSVAIREMCKMQAFQNYTTTGQIIVYT